MAMDKRWNELHKELQGIKDELAAVRVAMSAKPAKALPSKAQLMEIKGIGDSTADEILKLLK